MNQRRPIIVFTDASTRSAGELIAAWLWIAGSPVIGERTIGAGGGLEYGAKGFSDPQSGYSVRVSGNFTMFDPTARLSEGEIPELAWVNLAVQDSFAPSRQRPFTVQAVGMRPDVNSPSTLADLRDGGKAQVLRAVEELRRKKLLQ